MSLDTNSLGQKPHGNMSADQLIALFNTVDRHPKALDHELRTANIHQIIRVAYGEFAESPLAGVPDALASAAYDEMERRDRAKAKLLADVPSLRGRI